MRRHHARALRRALPALTCLLLLAGPASAADPWKPFTAEEIALAAPSVEKDADAEAIFWDIKLDDDFYRAGDVRTTFEHYLRVKVFSERGQRALSQVDLPYSGDDEIKDVRVRTRKPDGSLVELAKDALFDRTIVKAGSLAVKAKSFAVPGVEIGSIVEYRWKESHFGPGSAFHAVSLQRDIPIQTVTLSIRLLAPGRISIKSRAFRCTPSAFARGDRDFHTTSVTRMPAFKDEPFTPPPDHTRAWILVYYTDQSEADAKPETFWKEYGKQAYDTFRSSIKPNGDVRKLASATVAGANGPDEKLHRLFDVSRARVKNVEARSSGYTPEMRAKLKRNEDPGDTLSRGLGNPRDINFLFAALAQAAGFDARVALLGDRGRFFFNPSLANGYFLNTYNIAVKVGDTWRFFDPGNHFLPWGQIRWQEEVSQALISDPKEPLFVRTPLSPPEASLRRKKARLKLADDGTLEGDVTSTYTGHDAYEERIRWSGISNDDREKQLRESVQVRLPNAEVSEVSITGLDAPEEAVGIRYHVRVPAFAARTGKRLLLAPAYFRRGVPPAFTAEERRFEIYFHYPWSEQDDVVIDLPAGSSLEDSSWGTPFSVINLGEFGSTLAVSADGRTLAYTRDFRFAGGYFQTSDYPALKKVFEKIAEADGRQLSFRLAVSKP